jgi:ABC-type antimicrobial peptide transport system permease subunit
VAGASSVHTPTADLGRGATRPSILNLDVIPSATLMTLFARTSQPAAVGAAAGEAIHRLDPTLAVTRIQTFERALGESLARERLNALVSAGFALSGLLLASLGLYGLLAFHVTERPKEIGIRIALGAQSAQVTRSVVGAGSG